MTQQKISFTIGATRYRSRIIWQRLITTATVLAVLVQIVLPFSHFSFVPVAQAATITINSTADVIANDGNCTLREAIIAANTDTASGAMAGECAAGVGADDLTLPAGTYTLALAGQGENAAATGDLDIVGADNLTITGAGAATTIIDANDLERIFHKVGTGDLTITGVTIQNGSVAAADGAGATKGGGIFLASTGTVTIIDSVITDNEVTGAGEDGGGITNNGAGTLIIQRSTISNNRANTGAGGNGGGIVNANNGSNLTISQSTISTNVSGNTGGGIFIGGNGVTAVTNSTISGNTANVSGGYPFIANAGGGAISMAQIGGANNTLDNVTITANTVGAANNGGGIWEDGTGTITVRNSLIVGNTGNANQADCSGTITDAAASPNLVSVIGAGCTSSGGGTTANATVTTFLGPLANNGFSTQTHALLPTSPAIDAGGVACTATDQRGRPTTDVPGFGGGIPCDLGAFEFTPLPGVQIDSPSITEDDGGPNSQNLTFTVSLTAPINTAVTVDVVTMDSTAMNGLANDYSTTALTVNFPANVTTQTVDVPIHGDNNTEMTETFTLSPTVSTWARIDANSVGTGTINDDDGVTPSFSVNDISIAEGNSGTTNAIVTVSLSQNPAAAVTVNVDTSDGTATTADSDYVDLTTTPVTFNPGDPLTKTVTVQINGDTTVEPDETVNVDLTGATGGATISDPLGVITITNDDTAATTSTLSIADATIVEGNSGNSTLNFVVTLTPASSTEVRVDYKTVPGTALETIKDYDAAASTLIFSPGTTSQNIPIMITGDTAVEGTETFQVQLSNATGGATISRAAATGTITNDDTAPPDSGSGGDDDDDSGSAPAPPPAQPAAPAASAPTTDSELPVTTLPSTGIDGGAVNHNAFPWWIIVAGVVGLVALVWEGRRRQVLKQQAVLLSSEVVPALPARVTPDLDEEGQTRDETPLQE